MVYLRIAENCNSGQARYSENYGQKQQAKERNVTLWRKEEKVGVGWFKWQPTGGKQGFIMVMAFHWMNCKDFQWLNLLLGKEEISLPPAGMLKYRHFLLEMNANYVSSWGSIIDVSSCGVVIDIKLYAWELLLPFKSFFLILLSLSFLMSKIRMIFTL